jgi:hypothetical protein
VKAWKTLHQENHVGFFCFLGSKRSAWSATVGIVVKQRY